MIMEDYEWRIQSMEMMMVVERERELREVYVMYMWEGDAKYE